MHALRPLLTERIYDLDRAIDYLMSRDDVDPTRLGVEAAEVVPLGSCKRS